MVADGRIEIDTRIEKGNVEQELRKLQQEIRNMTKEMELANLKGMMPLQKQVLEVEKRFLELGKGLQNFNGSSRELMSEIQRLGAEHKKATDAMIKNNHLLTQSYIRQAATFMNASTHAEKLHSIYQQTNSALAKYTAGTLKAQAALQRFANSGSAAQIALEALGKNADPKKLRDFTQNLNQSLAQVPILALGAAAAFGLLTAAIAKAAKGPDVSQVTEKINQALKEYRDALRQRTQEIYDTWKLFEKAQIEAVNPKTLLNNLQSQVTVMQNWWKNLTTLTKRGIDEGLIAELRKMGPSAAGAIAALTKMSDSELQKYVELWREKHRIAKEAAATELEQLKERTKEKIQQLKDSITPLGASLERFKSTWAEALEPFIKTWGVIFSKIVDAATAVGELINKLNSISPVISTAIFSTLYLTTAFTLLAIPIALTGKYLQGLRAIAFAFLKPLAALASLLGVSVSIAAAWAAGLVAVGVALYALWKNHETFKNAVVKAWEKLTEVFGFIKPALETAKQAFENFKNAVIAAINGDFSRLGEIFAQIIPSIIAALVGGLPAVLITVARFLPAIAETISNNTGVVATAIQNVTNAIVDFLTNSFPKMIEIGVGILTNLINGIVQSLPTIIQTMTTVVMSLVQGITAALPTLIQAGTQIIDTLVNAVVTLLPLIISAGLSILLALIDGIVKSLPKLVDTAVKLIDTITKMLIANLPKIIDAGVKILLSVVDGIVKVLPQLINTAVNLIIKIANTIIQNLPKIIDAGVKILTALINGIIQVLPQLIDAGIKLVIAVAKAVIDNLPKIIDAGQKILKSLIQGIIRLIGELGSTVKDQVIGTIKEKFESFSLVETGKNIIQGLIDGISSMAQAVYRKAKEIANTVKETIQSALGIHSPSRVMMEFGRNTVEGLIIGIAQKINYLKQTSKKMSDVLVPDFRNPIQISDWQRKEMTKFAAIASPKVESTEETKEKANMVMNLFYKIINPDTGWVRNNDVTYV